MPILHGVEKNKQGAGISLFQLKQLTSEFAL